MHRKRCNAVVSAQHQLRIMAIDGDAELIARPAGVLEHRRGCLSRRFLPLAGLDLTLIRLLPISESCTSPIAGAVVCRSRNQYLDPARPFPRSSRPFPLARPFPLVPRPFPLVRGGGLGRSRPDPAAWSHLRVCAVLSDDAGCDSVGRAGDLASWLSSCIRTRTTVWLPCRYASFRSLVSQPCCFRFNVETTVRRLSGLPRWGITWWTASC